MRQSAKGCAAQIGRAIQPQQVILEYPHPKGRGATAIDMQPIGCIIAGVEADTDKVFKALSDPGRRLLLDRLRADNGQTLGQLCEHLDMTRQSVTKHLKLLEEATLIVTIWRGREKLHYLNPVPILEIADRWIGKFERSRLRVLADLKKNLEGETDG